MKYHLRKYFVTKKEMRKYLYLYFIYFKLAMNELVNLNLKFIEFAYNNDMKINEYNSINNIR